MKFFDAEHLKFSSSHRRRIAHVVNVFDGPLTSSAFVAQQATLESMRQAARFARERVDVRLLSIQLLNETPVRIGDFERLPYLNRTVLDSGKFRVKRPLPLIKDILYHAYEASDDADFLVFTNIDIGLSPHFYVLVDDLVDAGYDAFSITRRTLEPSFGAVADLPDAWAAVGGAHPGLDCFVFRRSAFPCFRLGTVAVGVPRVGLALCVNLICIAERFEIFGNLHATFHWGKDAGWRRSDLADYVEHNQAELRAVVDHFRREPKLVSHPQIAIWLYSLDLLPEELRKVAALPAKIPANILRNLYGRFRRIAFATGAKFAKKPSRLASPSPNVSCVVPKVKHASVPKPKKILPSDVFLISFPGSGGWLLGMLLAEALAPGSAEKPRSSDKTIHAIGTCDERINDMKPPRLIATRAPLFHLAPKSVYLVRDPRMIVAERFRRTPPGDGRTNFKDFLRSGGALCVSTGLQGPEASCSWARHVRGAIRFAEEYPDRILFVRHEDLRADRTEELRRILRFCGLYPESVENANVERRLSKPNRQTLESAFVPCDWRTLFDSRDLEYLHAQTAPALPLLGYDQEWGDTAETLVSETEASA